MLSQIGSQFAGEFLLSLCLGFLTAASLTPARTNTSWFRFLLGFLSASILSVLSAFLLRTAANGTPWVTPSVVSLMLITLGSCWGSWLGASWIGSSGSILWGMRQFLTGFAFTAFGVGTILWMCLSPDRSVDQQGQMSTAERRLLVQRFKELDPQKLGPNETAEVTLSQQELNQLANWGLSLLPGEHASQIRLRYGELEVEATLELPVPALGRRYLNLTLAGRPLAREGEIGFSPSKLHAGELEIPAGLLSVTGPLMVHEEWRNETTEPFFSSLESVIVGESVATVTYRRIDLKEGFVNDALVGLGVVKDLEDATADHVEHLIRFAQAEPRFTFSQCLEVAFRNAQERSQDHSAVAENQAAILALASVLGESKFRALVGKNIPQPPTDVRSKFQRVTLHGRRDWTKHFLISAALQVLSNNLVSLDIGVLKEELDADGGSGFSFGDLLADRAGSEFARRATASEAAARELQRFILAGFVDEDLVPAGHDLPEGLSDAQLKTRYGGVQGSQYKKMVDEIDRRITNVRAFQHRPSVQ